MRRTRRCSRNGICSTPHCIYWAPHHVQSLWGATSIFITENGRSGAQLFPLERLGQLRVDLRLWQPVRPDLRGLQDARAHAQIQRRMVPRGGAAERRGLRQSAEPCGSPTAAPNDAARQLALVSVYGACPGHDRARPDVCRVRASPREGATLVRSVRRSMRGARRLPGLCRAEVRVCQPLRCRRF
jgi:hypothetical protein